MAKTVTATVENSLTEGSVKSYTGLPMRGENLLAEAGRGYLYEQLLRLREAQPIAVEGSDPEGVHAMRVAMRRLRATLKTLEETVYDDPEVARLRRSLGRLAGALGLIRDGDVFLENFSHYEAKLSPDERDQIYPLREIIENRRTEGRKQMLSEIARKRTTVLFADLEKLTTRAGAGQLGKKSAFEATELKPTLVRHLAGSAIWRRYEEVLAYDVLNLPTVTQGSATLEEPPEVLHSLRIACKRLRYNLELFQESLPAATKSLLKRLAEVQSKLGDLHDHQVAMELSEQLLTEHPHNIALQKYHAYRGNGFHAAYLAFLPVWEILRASNFKLELAQTIAQV